MVLVRQAHEASPESVVVEMEFVTERSVKRRPRAVREMQARSAVVSQGLFEPVEVVSTVNLSGSE